MTIVCVLLGIDGHQTYMHQPEAPHTVMTNAALRHHFTLDLKDLSSYSSDMLTYSGIDHPFEVQPHAHGIPDV